MKISAIVQARFSSTRLPGKIMKEMPYGSGIPVLAQVIRRLKMAKTIDEIVVATTIEKENAAVVALSKKERVGWYRGSRDDVLARYYLAARQSSAEIVVRITSDCPCIDPKVVDLIVKKHITSGADYTSNTLKRTYPRGFDAEVFGFDALEKAYKTARDKEEREHVTPYLYRNPGIFKISQIEAAKRERGPEIRVTLDTQEDYALLCAVFDYLYRKNRYFGAREVVELFRDKPWLKLVNEKIVQKRVSYSIKEEFEEAEKILALQGLERARYCLARFFKDEKR